MMYVNPSISMRARVAGRVVPNNDGVTTCIYYDSKLARSRLHDSRTFSILAW